MVSVVRIHPSPQTLSIRKEKIFETKLTPVEICQKYDEYGKLYSDEKSRHDCQTIKKGDLVEYIDHKTKIEGKRIITISIPLQGIWDGTQVKFDDKEETIVRTTHWLRLISTSNL